jgi:hypothetical protein
MEQSEIQEAWFSADSAALHLDYGAEWRRENVGGQSPPYTSNG